MLQRRKVHYTVTSYQFVINCFANQYERSFETSSVAGLTTLFMKVEGPSEYVFCPPRSLDQHVRILHVVRGRCSSTSGAGLTLSASFSPLLMEPLSNLNVPFSSRA